MSLAKIVLIVYGLLLIVGGYMGYAKAGSKVSLIMGLVSGILVLVGVYLTQTPSVSNGYILLTLTSIFLVGIFLIRLLKTHQWMPSGMLLVASVVALLISVSCFFRK